VETEDLFEEFLRTATRGRRGGSGGGAGTGGGWGRTAQAQRGGDVTIPLSLSFQDAVLGTKKRVALPDAKTVEVVVPPGTDTGQQMRLKGQGKTGTGGGEAGDAFVEITVEPHAYFERKGKDIHLHLPVTLGEAALGAAVTVPTLTGKVALRVPKGSNGGTTLRLKGKGVPDLKGSSAGDQYVHLKLVLPEPPDGELEKFLERWRPRAYEPRKRGGFED
jgi:DnaJ-class molecular chaperone